MAVGITVTLVPETEYLPQGNRNFVIGMLIPPPGYNIAQLRDIADRIADDARPYWVAEPGSVEAQRLKGPTIGSSFFIVRAGTSLLAAEAKTLSG